MSNQKLKHGKPSGPMVDFYIENSIRGVALDSTRAETVPVTINGHRYDVKLGQRNRLPKEVVDVLRNSQSTVVPDASRHDPERGGVPHMAGTAPATKVEYQCDYRVEVIKEG